MEQLNKSDVAIQNETALANPSDREGEVQSCSIAEAAVAQHNTDQTAVAELREGQASSSKEVSGINEPAPDHNKISEVQDQTPDRQIMVSTGKRSSMVAHKTKRHDPGSTPSLYERLLARCSDRWVWEILGCLLAVASLNAIIIILALHQDLPIPNWPNMISINSWVSIFTAIMKAAIMLPISEARFPRSGRALPLLIDDIGISQLKWLWFMGPRPLMDMERFDVASRGPWGALILLFSMRGNYAVSFGALLTVVSLAIDPISQQIIQYYNCFPVAPKVFAAIPRTNNYTGDGIATRPGCAELNEAVGAAITLGTLDPPVNGSLIPFSCLSGNCTFPSSSEAAFQTLGMCHACKEINGLIRVNKTYPGYWLENWKGKPSWHWTDQPAHVGYTFPNTSLPYSLFWSRKALALDPAFDDLITFDALMLDVNPDCDVENSQDCQKHP